MPPLAGGKVLPSTIVEDHLGHTMMKSSAILANLAEAVPAGSRIKVLLSITSLDVEIQLAINMSDHAPSLRACDAMGACNSLSSCVSWCLPCACGTSLRAQNMTLCAWCSSCVSCAWWALALCCPLLCRRAFLELGC